MNNIPAGYQLHITTWENDGDYEQTKILSGLSKEDAAFYLDIAKLFTSRNDRGNKGFGNSGLTMWLDEFANHEVLGKSWCGWLDDSYGAVYRIWKE